ncbi:hypothetical protein LCGC14_1233220 [marine sediment metagenome]|uniref:Uncharacterized protein n=1 Tax=marine sediment metagenome TaxID=412755 RepID=A0A0F9NQ28_9ZZZZ
MEFRFKLDPLSDAGLIARILDQANGARKNNAARSLLRHWYLNEKLQVSPPEGQTNGAVVSTAPMSDEDSDKAKSILDDAW